jgi:hypothetical protein
MTTIHTPDAFIQQLEELLETKEDPDEWYILSGQQVGEYSVHSDHETPDGHDELPDDMQDATENVEGFVQIGSAGWASKAFEDEGSEFVSAFSFDDANSRLDTRINNLLLVHESMLSEEALDHVQTADSEEVQKA